MDGTDDIIAALERSLASTASPTRATPVFLSGSPSISPPPSVSPSLSTLSRQVNPRWGLGPEQPGSEPEPQPTPQLGPDWLQQPQPQPQTQPQPQPLTQTQPPPKPQTQTQPKPPSAPQPAAESKLTQAAKAAAQSVARTTGAGTAAPGRPLSSKATAPVRTPSSKAPTQPHARAARVTAQSSLPSKQPTATAGSSRIQHKQEAGGKQKLAVEPQPEPEPCTRKACCCKQQGKRRTFTPDLEEALKGRYRVLPRAELAVRRGCGLETELIDRIDSTPLHLSGTSSPGGGAAGDRGLEALRGGKILLVPNDEPEPCREIEAVAAVRIVHVSKTSKKEIVVTRLLVNTTPHRKGKGCRKLGWVTFYDGEEQKHKNKIEKLDSDRNGGAHLQSQPPQSSSTSQPQLRLEPTTPHGPSTTATNRPSVSIRTPKSRAASHNGVAYRRTPSPQPSSPSQPKLRSEPTTPQGSAPAVTEGKAIEQSITGDDGWMQKKDLSYYNVKTGETWSLTMMEMKQNDGWTPPAWLRLPRAPDDDKPQAPLAPTVDFGGDQGQGHQQDHSQLEGTEGLRLAWSLKNQEIPLHFEIQMSRNHYLAGGWKLVQPTYVDRQPSNQYRFVALLQDVSSGDKCYFRVRSRNDIGWSDWSQPSERIEIPQLRSDELSIQSSGGFDCVGGKNDSTDSLLESLELTGDQRKEIRDELQAQRATYMEKRALKVRVVTHNVSGEHPKEIKATDLQAMCCGEEADTVGADIAEHLPFTHGSPAETRGSLQAVRFDVIAVGLQQVQSKHRDGWIDKLKKCLGEAKGYYCNDDMSCDKAGVLCMVFVHRDHKAGVETQWEGGGDQGSSPGFSLWKQPKLENTRSCALGNLRQTNGPQAALVEIRLYETILTFVSCHLPSEQDTPAKRNEHIETIATRLLPQLAPPGRGRENKKETASPRGDTIGSAESSRSLSFALGTPLFWFGDLHYQVPLSASAVKHAAERLADIQQEDQLRQERSAGRIFGGMHETELCFRPTYKYEKGGSSEYDTQCSKGKPTGMAEETVPAWSDRVLWGGPGVRPLVEARSAGFSWNHPLGYTDHAHIMFSDHKPVSHSFLVELEVQNKWKLEHALIHIVRKMLGNSPVALSHLWPVTRTTDSTALGSASNPELEQLQGVHVAWTVSADFDSMEAARTLVAQLCPSEMQQISASTQNADVQTRHGTSRGSPVVATTYLGQSTPQPPYHVRDHIRNPDKPAALPGRKATATAGSPSSTRTASPARVSAPQPHLHAEAVRCLAALQAQLEHAINDGELRCASPGALQRQQWSFSLGRPPRLPAPMRQANSAVGTGEESSAASRLVASAERERAWMRAEAHALAVAEAIRIRREASL